ncbi:hypothetical protein GCM10017566_48410 [Amycolatopsis bartoniae]|uniref:Uncharacterized protein n=1 Tax=Amycolatopsis bartoniae TaxID=941986 RepID=A0A8H9J3F1_9PSEU|nr:hypothetical protein GCM10017566_48410 [Amycolatopsis bartoniae]
MGWAERPTGGGASCLPDPPNPEGPQRSPPGAPHPTPSPTRPMGWAERPTGGGAFCLPDPPNPEGPQRTPAPGTAFRTLANPAHGLG